MRYIHKFILLLLLVHYLLSANPEPPANTSIGGFIRDKETNETLIGVTVFLEGTRFGTYTNKNGYYSLANIPPGEYTLVISSIGYEKFSEKIKLSKGSSIRKDFLLKPLAITTEGISVEAERELEKREITISKVNVPVWQIKQIRIGGESDVFRSLQYLPGILTSSQLSSGLFVRGGSPDQNLILIDGSTVYNPTHLFGFISTFNPNAIKDVELIKGGFQAEYGGRLSSVLNITQKEGNRNKFEGITSIGAISSRISIEGPIANGSWFMGARRTYFELIKQILPKDPENPLPDFSFYDINAKITQDLGKNDKLSFSGFLSSDKLDYVGFGLTTGLNVGNRVGALRWNRIISENLFLSTNLSASYYFNNFQGDQSGYAFEIENSITDYTLKSSLEWFTNEKITHKFGFETSKYTFLFLQNLTGIADSTTQTGNSGGGLTNLLIHDWNHSLFSQINYRLDELTSLQGGFRINYWSNSDNLTFDPRLALRYQLTSDIALKGSWGMFHQNLRLASQNDFSFFDTWLPTDSTLPAASAMHYVFSIESTPFLGYDLNFDIYYKKLKNISELNNLIIEARTAKDVLLVGNAEAWGAEIFLQKKYGKINGWIGYALGFISARFDSINNGESFRPKYDRRHDLKIVVNYILDEKWEFGINFTFQSGQSYTGATSRFQTKLPGSTIGRGIVVPSQRFGLRLPPSHQLNFNAVYNYKLFGLDSRVILDIFNVYNRRDIWFRYYNTRDDDTKVEDVKLLPIIPSISVELKF